MITDSSAGALMARGLVDRIVVGADRIAANGDVANKIGTYPLAVLAAAPRRPVLRGRAAVDARPGHAHRRRDPDRGARRRPRSAPRPAGAQPRLRRDAGRAVTAIVTEAGVLEPPYEEAIAACRCGLRSSRPRGRCCGSGLVTGTAGNVSARDGRADPDHAERAPLRRR